MTTAQEFEKVTRSLESWTSPTEHDAECILGFLKLNREIIARALRRDEEIENPRDDWSMGDAAFLSAFRKDFR